MTSSRWPGLGPVFAAEWTSTSRRWQGYALRALVVLMLLMGLSAVWLANRPANRELSAHEWAEIGQGFYTVTSLSLLGLVSLAAPAATAGAICLDKARGNLTLLFATDLTNSEIVLGKLAARLVPVLGLIACAAPVLAQTIIFGGVDPGALLGALLVCIGCAVFGCTLALTLSVWGQKTHEVLLATYAFGILYLLLAPIWMAFVLAIPVLSRPPWLPESTMLLPYNPIFLVLAPLGAPPGMLPVGVGGQARFCALGLLSSALLAVLSTRRIRSVVTRQFSSGEPTSRTTRRRSRLARLSRLLPSPSLDTNPVLWREWHRRRPSRWSVAIWGLFTLISGLFAAWAIVTTLTSPSRANLELGPVISGFHVTAGLLLFSVSAATSLAEERQRGSLDVLLATPLSTRSIVMAKWWAALRGIPALTLLPMLILAIITSKQSYHVLSPFLIAALILAYGAAITSLGLALATWMPQMGRAIGVTAGLYVLVLVGAVPLGMSIFSRYGKHVGQGFAAASPFWGVGFSSALFAGPGGPPENIPTQIAWVLFWTLAYTAVAMALLVATILTFNRCLGRLDDSTTPNPRPQHNTTSTTPPPESTTQSAALAPIPSRLLADPVSSNH